VPNIIDRDARGFERCLKSEGTGTSSDPFIPHVVADTGSPAGTMSTRDVRGYVILVKADGTGTDLDPYIPHVVVEGAVGGGSAGVSSFNTRTGAVTLSSADVTAALTYTPPPNARLVSAGTGLTGGGDLSADRTISMPAVGPGAATYGDAGHFLTLTLDAQGRVTAATLQPGPQADLVTATDGATVTFDLSAGSVQQVVLGGNRTLAVSNDATRPSFLLILQQDATGSRTVTWWSGILWPGGTVPTLTTTASKRDVFSFRRLSTGIYLGFVVGQNL
jgi:hypothetical protein